MTRKEDAQRFAGLGEPTRKKRKQIKRKVTKRLTKKYTRKS